MQIRTYVVKMPNETPTNPLDILVLTDPGTQAAPVEPADGGAYYEVLGRPVRFESESGDTGFVPRLTPGFAVTITPLGAAGQTDIPGVQLSASLTSLDSTDSGGPVIDLPTLADGSDGPMIRLVGNANTAGDYFLVTLFIEDFDTHARSESGR